jgi:hypothetical protein
MPYVRAHMRGGYPVSGYYRRDGAPQMSCGCMALIVVVVGMGPLAVPLAFGAVLIAAIGWVLYSGIRLLFTGRRVPLPNASEPVPFEVPKNMRRETRASGHLWTPKGCCGLCGVSYQAADYFGWSCTAAKTLHEDRP